jgi:hypothetical protein
MILRMLICGLALAAAALPLRAQALKPLKRPQLSPAWIVDGLKTPEAVCYDAARDVLYVSNINDGPAEKDGNGFLSKITPEGVLAELNWVTGLSAPKGMAVAGDRLYVSDITDLVEVDVNTGQILRRFTHPDAVFLNDVAADAAGRIYVSDTRKHCIFRFGGESLDLWCADTLLYRPNGLCIEGSSLLCGKAGAVLRIDTGSDAPRPVVYIDSTATGDATDGLRPRGKKQYFLSDWSGATVLAGPGRVPAVILDTAPQKINSADLEYIAKRKLLIIPTFFDNRVIAYLVK